MLFSNISYQGPLLSRDGLDYHPSYSQRFEHTWCPAVRDIVPLVDSYVKTETFYDMNPLPSWTRDRLVLIGDSAHSFLPPAKPGPATTRSVDEGWSDELIFSIIKQLID